MKSLCTKFILTVITLLLPVVASAQDLGVILGYRSDNADADGAKVSAPGNFQGGLLAKFPTSETLWIRTGLVYAQRNINLEANGTGIKTDYKLSYFEVPLGALYKFSDFGGVFAGANIALNLGNSCDVEGGGSCSISGLNSSPTFFQFGGSFKIAPNFGFELYYEGGLSSIATGINNERAVVVNAMITFD